MKVKLNNRSRIIPERYYIEGLEDLMQEDSGVRLSKQERINCEWALLKRSLSPIELEYIKSGFPIAAKEITAGGFKDRLTRFALILDNGKKVYCSKYFYSLFIN